MRKVCCLLLLAIVSLLSRTAQAKVSASTSDKDPVQQALESLEKTVPLTYNKHVHKWIKIYSGTQKKRFSRMLGLSKYYFPIYEKVFRERNVPEEIKYLSVVESSLNPQAVSPVGATGLWQFLYEYGKLYGLAINDTVDERKDPMLSCNAAASYLLDSYNMYGDWLLAIASFNCGRNNIKWAMEKAGGPKDYWTLREYLPVETQNYVPAFIATVYLMNNYRKHGILPDKADFRTETEQFTVKETVSFDQVIDKTGMSREELRALNPAYTQGVIYGSETRPRKLVVPVFPEAIYSSLSGISGLAGSRKVSVPQVIETRRAKYFIMYRVQQGDSLASIAEKFKLSDTGEISRTNNNLQDPELKPGTVIRIVQYEN